MKHQRWVLFVLFVSAVAAAGCQPTDGALQLNAAKQQCVECGLRVQTDGDLSPEALRVFTRSCRLGDAAACSVVGVIFEGGRGVTKDIKGAARFYAAACRSGNARGCVNLGKFYARGQTGTTDLAGARTLFEFGCAQGNAAGCFHLGQVRFQLGDQSGARRALNESCRAGSAKACHLSATMHALGQGGEKDEARAASLYRRACQRGSNPSCNQLRHPWNRL
jgi:uncharacterized protein